MSTSPSTGLPVRSMASLPAMPDLVNMGVNDSTAVWPVGTKFSDIFGNSYMYVNFGYTSLQGDAVTYSPAATTNNGMGALQVIAPTTATLRFFAGFAMNVVTSGNYGFIQICGWNQVPLASTTTVKADWCIIANGSNAISDSTTAISGNNPPVSTYYIVTDVAVTGAAPAVNTVYFASNTLCSQAF